jgi:hypothetical protein
MHHISHVVHFYFLDGVLTEKKLTVLGVLLCINIKQKYCSVIEDLVTSSRI